MLKARGVELEMVLDEGGMIGEGILPGIDEPVALVGIAEKGFVPTPPSPMLGAVVTLAALGIGAILTIARPERGPHDWLLGTWVVPR